MHLRGEHDTEGRSSGDGGEMKGPKEIRHWINRLRQRHGKRNGVVSRGYFDYPSFEIKWANSRKQRSRAALKETP